MKEKKSKKELLKPPVRKEGLPEITLEELSGALEKDGRLLIGCKGMVFDVSARPDFYGKGSGYHLFVGFDSSVSLAKMKFD